NGSYTVGAVGTPAGPGEGASLVVFLERPTSTQNVAIVINDGAVTAKLGETMSTALANVVPGNQFASGTLNVGIGNGTNKLDGPITLDGDALGPPNQFSEHNGPFWDDYHYDLKGQFSFPAIASVTQGTQVNVDDCLTWAYAALTYVLPP